MYRVEIDPRKLGYSLGVAIRIRPAPRQLQAVAQLAQETPEVIECHRVTTSVVLRGIEGFGLHHTLHTQRILTLSEDLPLISVAV
ncbi:MAG: DUF190 domain-containing protein, partial [Actinobacteria bacterium]|nr:DUF190 domain-containing protein [Actinomycetota bacterium]